MTGSVTLSSTIDSMEKYLVENPCCWQTRRELADAYEDAGDELRSAYLRWSAKNEKRPIWFHGDGRYEWWWDEATNYCGDRKSSMGNYKLFEQMGKYLYQEHDVEDYRSPDMKVVEHNLALFLRHKQII